jgi:hypothetical protein
MVEENDILKFSPEMQADIRSEILDYQKKAMILRKLPCCLMAMYVRTTRQSKSRH